MQTFEQLHKTWIVTEQLSNFDYKPRQANSYFKSSDARMVSSRIKHRKRIKDNMIFEFFQTENQWYLSMLSSPQFFHTS